MFVLELARSDYAEERENSIAVGNSSMGVMRIPFHLFLSTRRRAHLSSTDTPRSTAPGRDGKHHRGNSSTGDHREQNDGQIVDSAVQGA